MSFPPPVPAGFPVVPPPLPAGWTEHQAPTGHTYYYHAQTKQSSYVRPLPDFTTSSTSQQPPPPEPAPTKKKKKEKPVEKTPIPGTPWIRVKTNEGNTFYTHTEKKESVWEVPEEIAEEVNKLEVEEQAAKIIAEMEKAQPPPLPTVAPPVAAGTKRKAGETGKSAGKKAKVEESAPATADMPIDTADDEAWQREVAAEMVAETKGGGKPIETMEKTAEPGDTKEVPKEYNMPQQVNLSPEEAKALFKTLLQEKDINPLTPYDSALPQLIKDPRYVLLPSLGDRHAAFNEYCLEKSRAIRASKAASTSSGPVDEKVKAREAYDALLKDEVKSTRMSFDEFRKKWKKDRRFFGFGRDDREREKVFKEWRNELGEYKRKQAQKAEADFFALLRENEHLITEAFASTGTEPAWKDVKKHKVIYSSSRYDAVGSSSLREELYASYLKARINPNATPGSPSQAKRKSEPPAEEDEAVRKRSRMERAEKATKEREEKVRREKARVDQDIHKSQHQLSEKEGADEFMTLLTDAIREPTATYPESVALLSRSPVFTLSRLSNNQKLDLFNAHVKRLQDKQMAALHALFEGLTPGLDAKFNDLPDSAWKSSPAVKLGISNSTSEMRYLWEDWQAKRTVKAREDFDKLLGENQFVGFWAGVKRMGKEEGGTVVPGVDDADAEEGDEGEGGGGKADLKALAKGIGEKQIEDVLKHDKRYRVWDHLPEERERWIKDFISRMAAPKLSVHVSDKS